MANWGDAAMADERPRYQPPHMRGLGQAAPPPPGVGGMPAFGGPAAYGARGYPPQGFNAGGGYGGGPG